jgi:hypothetical protein
MYNRIELLPLRLVSEYDGTQFLAVERSVLL